jgi:hypothetical protein
MREEVASVLLGLFISPCLHASAYDAAIDKALASGHVSLALAVSGVRLPDAQKDEALRKGVEEDVVTSVSHHLLSRFGDDAGFRLLDRQTVDVVLAEYVFQSQGFTRQVDASKIGSFPNTSHLLILSIAHDEGREFEVFAKLVTVGEARVLSAEKFSIGIGKTPGAPVGRREEVARGADVSPPSPARQTARRTEKEKTFQTARAKSDESRYLVYTLDARERGETPDNFDAWLGREKKSR